MILGCKWAHRIHLQIKLFLVLISRFCIMLKCCSDGHACKLLLLLLYPFEGIPQSFSPVDQIGAKKQFLEMACAEEYSCVIWVAFSGDIFF